MKIKNDKTYRTERNANMKRIEIKNNEDLDDYGMADYKDVDGILEAIDGQLSSHGLELVVGDYGDTNVWIKVQKAAK